MDKFFNHKHLPLLTVLFGAAGMLLRLWQLSTENDQGFVAQGHISGALLLTVTGIFLVIVFFMSRVLMQAQKYDFNFPPSAIAAAGTALAGVGIAIAGITDLLTSSGLSAVTALVGIVSAGALLLDSRCRLQGTHPSMVLHSTVCLWLMLRLICHYRSWSADPQLEDYTFQLLALVCAMLSTYHRAAFDTNEGTRPQYAFWSLSGVYFCIASLAGPDHVLLYLSLGLWLLTDLCNLTPMPRRYWSKQP